MTKKEVIEQIETLQLDLNDEKKLYILQIHFPKNAPKEAVDRISLSMYNAMKNKYGEFPKNILLFPSTDDVYIEKIEVTKEDKLK